MLRAAILYDGVNSGPWSWSWYPSVLAGLGLIVVVYLYLANGYRRRVNYGPPVPPLRQASFLLGILMVFLALLSPLDSLSDHYLFSAHMVQHILLVAFAPVLWLLGVPDGLLNALVRAPWLRRFAYAVTRPIPAFLIFNGVFLIWHVPNLYILALEEQPVHIAMHLSFLASAVIGWWPVYSRFSEAAPRASLTMQLFYLFFMMFPTTALSAWITLSPGILYPFYGSQALQFGLSPHDDQQLSGLIMWIPGNALFFIAFSIVFFQWFQRSQSETSDLDPARDAEPLLSIQE